MSIYSTDLIISMFLLSGVGVVIFGIVFLIMVKIAPFSVVKEIEEDQNTSLAIIFGSVFIALAIIISSAIA